MCFLGRSRSIKPWALTLAISCIRDGRSAPPNRNSLWPAGLNCCNKPQTKDHPLWEVQSHVDFCLKRGSQKHSPDPSRVQKCRNLGWISAKKTANMGKHMSCRVAQVRRSGQRKKCQASRPRNSKQKASRPTRGFAECLVSVLHQENPHLKVGYFLDGCSVLPFCIKTIKFWFLWFSWQALWGFVRFGPNRSSSE